MRGRVALAVLILASVNFSVPGAQAEADYWVDYAGTMYPEKADMADRFQHISPEDVDGDGYLDPHVIASAGGGFNSTTTASVTNAQIGTASNALGIAKADMIAQIQTILEEYPQWEDNLSQATDLINDGKFKEAEAGLDGTPTDVKYYCESRVYDWNVAIPFPMDCEPDSGPLGDQGFAEVYIAIEVIAIYLQGSDIDGIDLTLTSVATGLNTNSDRVILGAGYRTVGIVNSEPGPEVSLGFFSKFYSTGPLEDSLHIDLYLSNLAAAGDDHDGRLLVNHNFAYNDNVFLSFGALRDPSSQTHRVRILPSSTHEVAWSLDDRASGWILDVEYLQGHGFFKDYRTSGTRDGTSTDSRITILVLEIPAEFSISRSLEVHNFNLGSKEILQFWSPEDLYYMEAVVNVHKDGVLVGAIDFVGFPKGFVIRTDAGENPQNPNKSVDIRVLDGYAGYFRAIVVDVFTTVPRPDLVFQDVQRLYLVGGLVDPWNSDDEPYMLFGINIAKCEIRSHAAGYFRFPFIGNMNIKVSPYTCPFSNPDVYEIGSRWSISDDYLYLYPRLSEGDYYESDGFAFPVNIHWWVIPDEYADQGNCVLQETLGGETACP